jgi:hypothetical protein
MKHDLLFVLFDAFMPFVPPYFMCAEWVRRQKCVFDGIPGLMGPEREEEKSPPTASPTAPKMRTGCSSIDYACIFGADWGRVRVRA